jgi:CheY-like chemotaxis protein
MPAKLNFRVVPLSEVPLDNLIQLSVSRRPVVLVVDDERIIADTLSMILSKSGYEVLTAYNGLTALELAENAAPDLLITDVFMPGMSGIELAISLEQVVPECKVLMFSGQADTIDLLEKARDTGRDFSLLTKPVHPTDMLRRVSNCLAVPAMMAGVSAGASFLF